MSLRACFNTSMLLVHLRSFLEVVQASVALMLMMIHTRLKKMFLPRQMKMRKKKKGKRKAEDVVLGGKKARNPMVRQVS
jgi:hypothetical protein